MTQRAAVFLDRDGTLNVDPGFVHRVDELVLLDGVEEALGRLAALDLVLVVVTNQSGVARGRFTLDQMHAFHGAMAERLAEAGAPIEAFYWCPHYPDGTVPAFAGTCGCRKPEPGLLERAADELGLPLEASFMIGDRETDVEAGEKVGCTTIRLHREGAAPESRADHTAADLLEAARVVERTVEQRRKRGDER